MLPYYDQPYVELGPIPVHAFSVLVLLAVVLGIEAAAKRAPSSGIDPNVMSAFALWILVPGFVGAHVFDALWYHPDEVSRDPAMLFDLFFGMSSFGGFLGAVIGALAWRFTMHEDLLPYVDVVMSVFPISWALGRAGCTLAHDHPGIHTSPANPLAFAFPDGPRWDLGFLEMLLAIGLSIVFVLLWRKRPPRGTYLALGCLVYAPARFGLDFLRADVAAGGDARYANLTPAQWACMILLALGMFAVWNVADERGRALRSSPLGVPSADSR